MKTIGLIGGMSWESTQHYYALINARTAARRGGLASAPLLVHSLDFAPIAAMQEAGDWPGMAEILADSARRLQSAGADLIGIATNTMHKLADEVAAAVSVPLLHIADPTADALVTAGHRTVGLLGTKFTMTMPFYADRLRRRDLDVLVPEAEIEPLNAIIYDELCLGTIRDPSRDRYVAAIRALADRGATAVILGCTEIGLLIDQDVSPLPVFDTTVLHAEALVDAALR